MFSCLHSHPPSWLKYCCILNKFTPSARTLQSRMGTQVSSLPQVHNEQYFLVTMDDLCGIEDSEATKRSFLCHRDSPGIFPAQWSLKNGVPLSPPPGLLCPLRNIKPSVTDLTGSIMLLFYLLALLIFFFSRLLRIPGSRLWLGGLLETMWSRGSSPELLPYCKSALFHCLRHDSCCCGPATFVGFLSDFMSQLGRFWNESSPFDSRSELLQGATC